MSETFIGPNPPHWFYRPGIEFDCCCARCGSSVATEHCTECEDGFDGHDCGEDCCCCAEPEENVACRCCDGTGLWRTCLSSADWCNANPLTGREDVKRGEIEWFTFAASED